jgi:hypothetical protein
MRRGEIPRSAGQDGGELSDPRRRFAHVFEGGGFGVGVTVTPLEVEPWPVEFLPAGVSARPTRLGEMMPVAARTDAEIAVETHAAGWRFQLSGDGVLPVTTPSGVTRTTRPDRAGQ